MKTAKIWMRLVTIGALLVLANGCEGPAVSRVRSPKHSAELGLSSESVWPAFEAYDRALVESIRSRWYSLIEKAGGPAGPQGEVVIAFRLNEDGTVSDLKVVKEKASSDRVKLSQSAITEAAPFPEWTPEQRRVIRHPNREIRFTFLY